MMSVTVTAAAIPAVRIVIVRYTEACKMVWKFTNPHTRSICDVRSFSRQKAVMSIKDSDAR